MHLCILDMESAADDNKVIVFCGWIHVSDSNKNEKKDRSVW